MDNSKRKPNPNPRETTNFLSILFFTSTLPLFVKGYKKDLDIEDIYDPLKQDKSSGLGSRLESKWTKHLEECNINKNKKACLRTTILKTYWKEIVFTGFILFMNEAIIRMSQPLFLGMLLSYFVANSSTTKDQALIYAGSMVALNLLGAFFINHYMLKAVHLGMKVRIAMCSLIYRKALRLNKHILSETASGKVVNLLSNDVSRFDIGLFFVHYMWVSPISAIIVLVILWLRAGYAGLIGMATLFLTIPFQAFIGKLSSKFRFQTAFKTDERVRLMEEIISGIQVIKMYAWETPFAKIMNIARQLELNKIIKAAYIRACFVSFTLFSTRFALYATVMAIAGFGQEITADKVFVISAYYNILTMSVSNLFVRGIAETAEILTAIKRLQTFLLYDEFETSNNKIQNDSQEHSIKLSNFTAKWDPSSSGNTINNININVPMKHLVGVIGPVGCGKSSLLQSLLDEMTVTNGTISVNGTVSYASQEAWIFAASVRQNILFGQPYDKAKYNDVVEACALISDFKQLPHGDMTMVGDRGASLSGGQKARINMARAVYRDADVYLLDDPLSAVDTHVGKHLFERCIHEYLRSKTVVLVTHQLQYIKDVDLVIVMSDGKIEEMGTFDNVIKSTNKYAELLTKEQEELTVEEDVIVADKTGRQSIISNASKTSIGLNEDPELKAQLAELTSKGTIKGNMLINYLKSSENAFFMILVLGMFILAQAAASGADYWVSYWVNQEEQMNKSSTKLNEYIYSGLIVSIFVFAITRSIAFYNLTLRCSKYLHLNMFMSIIKSPMRFFYTNPTGRIINRFSKDVGIVDELLPRTMIDSLQLILMSFGAIILAVVVNPYFLIVVSVLVFLFVMYRKVYLKTTKNLKRLDGITRSPVFIHLNATLKGLTTIRALRAQSILTEEFDKHQDLNTGSWFMFICTATTFGFTLDFLCFIFVTIVTFSFILISNSESGGNVALAITQSMSLSAMLQFALRTSSDVENFLMSTERVMEYTKLKPESNLESGKIKPPEKWPSFGEILFRNTYLKYAESEPYVLQNLNITINSKDKIGIVGRTGAGKSSLITALFRLAQEEGEIIIDGINIKDISKKDLRSKISIIPQDPILFSGTLRMNLDPFNEYSDFFLWKALEDVELKDSLGSNQLDSVVSEYGSNYSVGQRQLVCLARAILRNNKILILDEATANVDPQTDRLIQTTIREKFADCTVLTVAHRLNTIMDSDKVLVMDAGKMIEYDHPHVLCQNTEGHFYKMVAETGPAMTKQLYEMAQKDYESKYVKENVTSL